MKCTCTKYGVGCGGTALRGQTLCAYCARGHNLDEILTKPPHRADPDDRAIVDAAAIKKRGGSYKFVGTVRDGMLVDIKCVEVKR